MIIDVKQIVEEKKELLKEKVNKLKSKNITPKLAVILASSDSASRIYVNKKNEMCKELNIDNVEFVYDENVTNEELINKIDELNKDKNVHGILVQLPLYKHLDENKIIEEIDVSKDVDGFTSKNMGNIACKKDYIVPCTPKGILSILKDTEIEGKNVVVMGRSKIVGLPMALLLNNKNATVTLVHSKTKNVEEFTKEADILIVAIGKAKFVTKDMIKEGSTVIDVGINRIDGKLYGDVDFENVKDKVSYITKVPGGVGVTTVVSLMENLIEIAEKKQY